MKTTELSDLLAPVVAALGLEIDRIEVLPAGRRKVVRVFLDGDGPDGRGPSLDNVADATRAISASLASLAGLMESKYLPEAGATNLPPMKWS